MRIVEFNPNIHEPFEIGARLIAALTFPSPVDEPRQKQAALAWCHKQIAFTVATHRNLQAAHTYPRYARMHAKQVERTLFETKRRLRDRMAAARMARAFFQEAETGAPAILAQPMQRVSINELCKLVRRDSAQNDPDNVKKRVWRPSKPVIHIASAIDYYGTSMGLPGLRYDLQDLEGHRAIVGIARRHEEIVLADKRFGVSGEDMIRLRWIE